MPKSKYLFSKLIKCNCGYNFRGIKDRSVRKYICYGYSTKQPNSCTERYAIRQDNLLHMVQIFCNRNGIELELSNDFMKSIIKNIFVNTEEDSIKIAYKNGEDALYNNNQIII